MDQRFRVRFHSVRRRLTDPDGLYTKAALDGLTAGGVLVDDNASVIGEISYAQERAGPGEAEETIITLEEIPALIAKEAASDY